jgi:hypothetical protein
MGEFFVEGLIGKKLCWLNQQYILAFVDHPARASAHPKSLARTAWG